MYQSKLRQDMGGFGDEEMGAVGLSVTLREAREAAATFAPGCNTRLCWLHPDAVL